MGRHDHKSHFLHTPKKQKFQQAKPAVAEDSLKTVPQMPKQGRSNHNMFK